MKYWIKYPGPGEFRGEGKWEEVTKETFDAISEGFLPKHQGLEPPKE